MSNLVYSISEGALPVWYRWLTGLTIAIPIAAAILTGLCGWCAYVVNERIGTLQSGTISTQTKEISQLTGDLETVRKQAQELAKAAINAGRGISDTYDFRGVHQQQNGHGRRATTAGPETAVFNEFQTLGGAQKWKELLEKTESQIKLTPSWLTPYLFSGIASANLGDFAQAQKRLQFVVDQAGDDPSYAEAPKILSDIQFQLRQPSPPRPDKNPLPPAP